MKLKEKIEIEVDVVETSDMFLQLGDRYIGPSPLEPDYPLQ